MPISHISQQEIPAGEEVQACELRPVLFHFVKTDFPDFEKNDYISIYELNQYRRLYLNFLIEQEKQELANFDQRIAENLKKNATFFEEIEEETEAELTTGQRIADKVAAFGGS